MLTIASMIDQTERGDLSVDKFLTMVRNMDPNRKRKRRRQPQPPQQQPLHNNEMDNSL
jgi:hypothetical protein